MLRVPTGHLMGGEAMSNVDFRKRVCYMEERLYVLYREGHMGERLH